MVQQAGRGFVQRFAYLRGDRTLPKSAMSPDQGHSPNHVWAKPMRT